MNNNKSWFVFNLSEVCCSVKPKESLDPAHFFHPFPSWREALHSRMHDHDLILFLLSNWCLPSKHEHPHNATWSCSLKSDRRAAVPLNHRAVCSQSSLCLFIRACVRRLLLPIRLTHIPGLLYWKHVWIIASSVSQSPLLTRASPLMNNAAAHYWKHFTVVWHSNEWRWSAFEYLVPGKVTVLPSSCWRKLWFMKSSSGFTNALLCIVAVFRVKGVVYGL